ncbi:MAG: DUF1573 domain-containing protein [bacterium]|nr:DUF1573 domain-containing protein [bacterium]
MIKPGASEEITASFNSRNLVGNFTKRVNLTTNDPKQPKMALLCKGRVLVPFRASPKFANFTDIEDGTTPLPMTVSIRRGDGGPLNLEVKEIHTSGVEVDLQEIEPGEQYELTIGITPPQKPGKLRSWIKVKTGVKELPETTIPVYATIPRGWAQEEFAAVGG